MATDPNNPGNFGNLIGQAIGWGRDQWEREKAKQAQREAAELRKRNLAEAARLNAESDQLRAQLRFERNQFAADAANLEVIAQAYAWALDDLAKHYKIPRERVEQKVLEYRERLANYKSGHHRRALSTPEEAAAYSALSIDQQAEFDYVGSAARKPRFLDWLDTKIAQERVEQNPQIPPDGARTKRASGTWIAKDFYKELN
ncbi:hypothetical protein A9R16_008205 [Acidiferrobacter thiooxydans]|uniref:hypothetical protein n=1 Tax=Acidiferrobacter thiooxydans TaxID=163359 RepID=UPI000826D942|nr:hypothetical protein [Acidiferrobacter thiooxydans]MDA8119223.1 hypothetical protein [Gammaproteobacteria bacterium]UEN98429.1 hypothetical protein A9R16_008205 [Acidiferrobacter thiooxydans]